MNSDFMFRKYHFEILPIANRIGSEVCFQGSIRLWLQDVDLEKLLRRECASASTNALLCGAETSI